MNDERYEILLMKAVDGLLDEAEEAEWLALLSADEEVAREFAAMTETFQHTQAYRERMLLEYRQSEVIAGEQGFVWSGIVLLLAGYVVLGGAAVVALMLAPDIPLWVKGAVAAVATGGAMVLAKVTWDRVRTHGADQYTKVDR